MRRRVTISHQIYEISQAEIDALVAKAKSGQPFTPDEAERLERIARAYVTVVDALKEKSANVRRLRRALFGAKTEKPRTLLGENEDSSPRASAAPPKPRKRPPGHGRNGAVAYPNAPKVCVPHETLKPGERCPACGRGRVYEQKEPGILVRVTGQAPVAAAIYLLQKLRCNLCGEIFEARPPQGVGDEKYDATAASMIGLLKYGSGLPFHRLQKLQHSLGIPLPATTQGQIVRDTARTLQPAYEELIRQAAQGEIVHNNDTPMKILAWMGRRREETLQRELKDELAKNRTGIFTSGIVSVRAGRRVALFFTGRRHAGENLATILKERAADRSPPIQMCDALSRNVPEEFRTILANCLGHGRRQFVDVMESFPRECARVLKILAAVYGNDAVAKRRGMKARERLRFHQERSGPLMEKLRGWMVEQLDRTKVEPNSGLGQAMRYKLKHWDKLTLFLRRPGAPLDNNLCERALQKAILHRKNSLPLR